MKPKIFIILILIAVLVSSCWYWFDYSYTKACFSEADKQIIPYKLVQTVNFIDSLGQYFILTVTRDSLFLVWEYDDYCFERKEVYLQSDHNNFLISLTLSANYDNIINIYIRQFNFNFRLFYNSEGMFYTNTEYNTQYYHESMEINNKIYYDVIECIGKNIFYANKPEQVQEYLSMRILYNKTYGILQLDEEDKTLFMINN